MAVLGLPLLGAAWAGRELSGLFRFPPPLEIPTAYLRFSWTAAGAVVGALAFLARAWCAGRKPRREEGTTRTPPPAASPKGRFPAWGWVALAWIAAWWVLAWNRFGWFAGVQRYTFFPLWLGFVVFVNGVSHRRTASCLMRRSPRLWLSLFGTSAIFWWGFEWLNRFVRNWHYLAVQDFGPLAYAAHATLCFSTVLPAVAAVAEGLQSSSRWMAFASRGPAWTWLDRPAAGVSFAAAGAVALVCTGAFPRGFYPALWSAPLALGIGYSILRRTSGWVSDAARGDWARPLSWAAAGLICGFFWELWNARSLAKWIYTVPGVDRWHVFEMPALGYTGYLPFGLECLLVFEILNRGRAEGAAQAVD
ncbi:hypothetical protein DB347_21200 [Opitutaceae bacterium EW11]|nr:hypothetical protein DB347_21200 [Opitutaceae bacterium EW11]